MHIFTGDRLSEWSFVLLAAGSSSAAVLVAWLCSGFAGRLGLVSRRRRDRFGPGRLPLTGGVGLLLGIAAPLVSLGAPVPAGFAVGALGLFGVGLVDDLRDLRPPLKLALQLGAALAAVLLSGGSWAQAGVGVVLLVGLVNACNYLDNMDGLLPGVALTQATALAFFGLQVGLRAGPGATLLIWVLPGIFLLNLPPARVYLGDSGSHLVGALLALDALALLFEPTGPRLDRALPLAVLFAVPLLDTATVTVSRLRRRRPLLRGGLDHLSHRLVRLGMPVRGAVAVLVLGSAACGVASLLLASS
ncbi:MAG: hypothetical protein ACE5JG_06585 [Planctomycetota bacterium]